MIELNWINDYWQLEKEIMDIELDIKKSEIELLRWGSGGDLFKKSSFQVSLLNLQRVEGSITSLKSVLAEKQLLKEELVNMIAGMKGLDNQIIRLKYIDGLTCEKIAQDLNYSAAYIFDRHATLKRRSSLLKSIDAEVFATRKVCRADSVSLQTLGDTANGE